MSSPETNDIGAPRRRFRLAIGAVLMLGFGGLVALASAGVLTIGLWSAQRNTYELLREKAETAIATMATHVDQHLEPARAQVEFLAEMVAVGGLDPTDIDELRKALVTALAATPQVRGLAVIDTQYTVFRVSRRNRPALGELVNWSNDPNVRRQLEDARAQPGSYWGELFWSNRAGETLINLRAPLWRGEKFLGLLISTVAISDLSGYIAKLSAGSNQTGFVLYGSDYVLAHPNMRDGYKRAVRQPLPELGDVNDPALATIWNAESRQDLLFKMTGDTRGHVVQTGSGPHIIFYRQVGTYGGVPWLIGIHMASEFAGWTQLRRLVLAAAMGFVVLLISLITALVMGQQLRRPIADLADAARAAGELEFNRITPLRPSRMRELDDAASAFNSMVSALRWFETYVPRALVRRLMDQGEHSDIGLEEREITVMFTDIDGFTGIAQDRSAIEIAGLLNHHFTLVAGCIEAENGTLDKYMGDSVMAFWGAPTMQSDHALRACRAAAAIKTAVEADNEARRARGEPAVTLRVGLHTGRAIIGNIGAPGRINYTIVGDTVNIAQRMQELGRKRIGGDGDVQVVVSATTAEQTGGAIKLAPLGEFEIRGRDGRHPVYRLA